MNMNNMSTHEYFDGYKSKEASMEIEILGQGVEKFKVAMDFKVDLVILPICSILLTPIPLTSHCFFAGRFYGHDFFDSMLMGICKQISSMGYIRDICFFMISISNQSLYPPIN